MKNLLIDFFRDNIVAPIIGLAGAALYIYLVCQLIESNF